jgi:hypothetical protein
MLTHYMPTMPPPSIVDAYKQPPGMIAPLGGGGGAGGGAAAAASGSPATPAASGAPPLVRKRYRVTDNVRIAARRKKRTGAGSAAAVDANTGLTREFPERLELDVPDSLMVRQLLALERRIDASIARKQVEIQHALLSPKQNASMVSSWDSSSSTQHASNAMRSPALLLVSPCADDVAAFVLLFPHALTFLFLQTPQILRIFLWHEHSAGAMADTPSSSGAESASFMLKIQGHILEADVSSGKRAAVWIESSDDDAIRFRGLMMGSSCAQLLT